MTREVRSERVFEASRERVWQALTEPALLTQWWGRGNRVVVERFELYRGGHWRFVEHADDGVHGFEGRFREVQGPERLVQTFDWDGAPGHPIVTTTTLESLGPERTKLVTVSLFFTEEDRDAMVQSGMAEGQEQSYRALDQLLAARRADAPSGALPSLGSTGDEHELRALVERWACAVRDGDLDSVLEPHTEDVLLFDVAGALQHRGSSEYRRAWAPFLDGGPHQRFELGELRLHVAENVAFAHALLGIEPGREFAVRLTLGFVKQRGVWKIAHEHHSSPV